jgi:hypothetical protein
VPDMLPLRLARPRRRAAQWWAPGRPIHPPDPSGDYTVADVVLSDRRPCWHRRDPDDLAPEDGAMRWTPDQPAVRFR